LAILISGVCSIKSIKADIKGSHFGIHSTNIARKFLGIVGRYGLDVHLFLWQICINTTTEVNENCTDPEGHREWKCQQYSFGTVVWNVTHSRTEAINEY
jgi:hypothetical protein